MGLLCLLCCLASEPVILENGTIRVEVDPAVFAIRFVGLTGERNWVDPGFVSEAERNSAGPLDPGGLFTGLVPDIPQDAALLRGPATIISQDAHGLVLLGPESPQTQLQIKKEIRLADTGGRAQFSVTVLSSSNQSRKLAIRNSVRIPQGMTLCLNRSDGDLRVLSGTGTIFDIAKKSLEYWLIAVPTSGRSFNVTLGAPSLQMSLQANQRVWSRRLAVTGVPADQFPDKCAFTCALDDASRAYTASLQGPMREVSAGSPLVLTEDWDFDRHGK